MNCFRKVGRFLKAWILGAVACQSFLGAVLATGWSYRFGRRQIMAYWSKKSGHPIEVRSPGWFCSEGAFEGSWWQRVKWCFCSLKMNVLAGAGHGLTAFLVTLVPGLLLAFAWWGGWNNSFNKGYEQASVGPGLGLLGVVLMALALLYLPMAQAHQAAYARVGAFFEFGVVGRVIRQSVWGNLMLAVLTALCGLPFVLSAFYLSSAVATQPELLEMPPVEIVAFLNKYYFFWALAFVFPAFLMLRLIAAKVYARATWRMMERGRYQHTEMENRVKVSPPKIQAGCVKWLRRSGKLMILASAYAVLLSFAGLPLISQFASAEPPVARWLSHPMVQWPLFYHIPEPLEKAAASEYGKEPEGFITWLDEQE